MRRFFLAALLTLAFAVQAWADKYVDNRYLAQGTGKAATSDTTHIATTTFYVEPPWTVNDLQYAGLIVTGGTNAPAVTKPFKILSVDATSPTAPVFEVHQTFNGANIPQNDWTFTILYGCNANTTYTTPTKAASLTGPRITPYLAYANSADGDTIWFRKSGRRYNGVYDASFAYILANVNGRNVTLDGYTTTPGDMSTSGTRVTQAQADEFPIIDNPASAYTIATDPGLTNPTAITIKHLTIINANASGAALRSNSAAGQFVVQEAQLQTADMASSGYTFLEASTSGVAKAHSFTDSILFSENVLLYGGCWKSLTVDDCLLKGVTAAGAGYFCNFFGTENSATNHPLKIDLKNSTWDYNGPDATVALVLGRYLTNSEFRFTNNIVTNNQIGKVIDIQSGLHFAVIDGNTITTSTSTTAHPPIGFGNDTVAAYSPMHSVVTQQASTTASGTVPSTSSVTLAAGSATDDFYNGMFLRVGPTEIVRRITDYNGTTKVATIWGTWGTNPTNGQALTIVTHDRTYNYVQISNNNIRFTGDTSHGILVAQGVWGGVNIYGNKVFNADEAFVIKCEGAEIYGNYAYSGLPLLLKGASFCYVHHNTFICTTDDLVVCQLQDKSDLASNLHGVEFSHCTGNVIVNNIFVSAVPGAYVMSEGDFGAGSWADNASLGPLRQNNRIDYNVYYRPDRSDDGTHGVYKVYDPDTAGLLDIPTLAAMQTKWAATVTADGQPFGRMCSDNDAHSVYGSITFASPATGDFRITGGTAARTLGSDGLPVGAGRTNSRVIVLPVDFGK